MKLPILLLTDVFPQKEYEHLEIFIGNPDITLHNVETMLLEKKPVLILSTGSVDTWQHLFPLPLGIRKHWSHLAAIPESEAEILQLYLGNTLANRIDRTQPLITVFTTTFHSKHKILRPLESLRAQTYSHWEWIVWDDSKDDETFTDLQAFAAQDARIRVFKAPAHSGFIGDTKQMSASLARGKWLVEVDHDDVVDARLLEIVADVDRKHPDAEFMYSDFVELYEDEETPFSYGDFFAFGYGAYVRQYLRGKYHNVAQSIPLNPTTLSHIVGYPNHVRAWKTSVYHAIGGHNPLLPVVDDMELMIRTFLHSPPGTWVRICAPLYYQYRNAGGNNFTFKRNSLIQALVPPIHQHYLPQLRAKYAALGWECPSTYPTKPVWESEDSGMPPSPSFERFYVPEDQDPETPCISVVLVASKKDTYGEIQQKIARLQFQKWTHWLLFVVATKSSDVLPQLMHQYQDDRIRYYEVAANPERYAMTMLVKTTLRVVYHQHPDDRWTDPLFLQNVARKHIAA